MIELEMEKDEHSEKGTEKNVVVNRQREEKEMSQIEKQLFKIRTQIYQDLADNFESQFNKNPKSTKKITEKPEKHKQFIDKKSALHYILNSQS